ncbi:Iron-dependent repressor IdeR [Cardinium endosymbiont of Culicoides punctatus]|nr:Iron-dependent repressor IdeR [Cardinium endosymbiont of Culicoides punctatus]
MKLTHSEENYLKAIYLISEENKSTVSTTALATFLNTSAASTTDMLQRLHSKELVMYQKYHGVSLSEIGRKLAVMTIRKYLLWQVFLVDKLKFDWNDIHHVADQLQYVDSDILIDRLENFLGHPYCSPHGVVIPSSNGKIIEKCRHLLTDIPEGESAIVSAIKDDSASFLQYLNKRNIYLGAKITVLEKIHFDESIDVIIDNQYKINVSRKITDNILVTL